MATETTLALRKIRPHPRPSAWEPNPARQASKARARDLGVSVRRVKRMEKAARLGGRLT